MDDRVRAFVESAPLLFIASRNSAGALDVSPRGGQPSVLRIAPDGRWLLPDVMGNKRLDTIGNVLVTREVAGVLVRRGSAEVLKFRARAEVSFDPDLLARFPADELPLMSVMVLTPRDLHFAATTAFDRAGFWLDPSKRRPPLDLLAVLLADFAVQAAEGNQPVLKQGDDEAALVSQGIRKVYGNMSDLVRTKVYATAKSGTQSFIDEARFLVLARAAADGSITIDLSGEAPLALDIGANQHPGYTLTLPTGTPRVTPATEPGEAALLGISPGRAEVMRMNGTWAPRLVDAARDGVALTPREIYFHCPLAMTRSRMWMADRSVPWTGRRRFICDRVVQESPEIKSFLLRPVDHAPLSLVPPGQYVSVSLADDPVDPPRRRSYSISGQPDAHSLRISVRRIGAGGLSDLLHERIAPGSELLLGVPGGRFVLDSPAERPVVLIAAGVGATPLLPMLARLAASPGAPVWFVQAARDGANHPFATEVATMAATARRPVTRLTAHSRPGPDDRPDLTGRVTAAWLAQQVPLDADFYLCGPETFMAELADGLAALGADPARVRTERFQSQAGPLVPMAALAGRGTACQVTFRKSGLTTEWDPASGTLLDLAIRHRIDLSWSCRMGDCQSCVQKLVTGKVDHLSEDEPMLGDGQVLMCQAVPLGDLVLDC